MKRTLLTAISVILVLASIFGLYAAVTGQDDLVGIRKAENETRINVIKSIDIIEDNLDDLDRLQEDRDKNAMEFAEGTAAEQEGSKLIEDGQEKYDSSKAQYDAGKAQYDAGKAQYDAGEKEYAAAKALYDQRKQAYDNAVERLEEGEAQLAVAKQQRDEGQAQLDEATPAYTALKGLTYMGGPISGPIADAAVRQFGYNSAEEAMAQYEAGQAKLDKANADIAAAEQTIADGKAQLADAKKQLDAGKVQLDEARAKLDASKKQLDAGKAQLDAGKAQLDAGKKQLDEGKQELQDKTDAMAAALENLQDYDNAQEAVEAGIKVLLENDMIAEKVSDPEDYHAVLDAAREYMDENADNLDSELALREQLCKLLLWVSVVGVAAGAVCLIAAFAPSLGKLKFAVTLAVISSIVSAAYNIYGFMNGYNGFIYTLADGSGSGTAQFASALLILISSVIALLLASSCLKSYKIGMGLVKPAKIKPKDEDDEEFEDEDEEEFFEDEEEDFVPENKQKNEKNKKNAPKNKPEKQEKPKHKAPEMPQKPQKAQKPVIPSTPPEDELLSVASDDEAQELERARREYEESLRKFEEARRRAKGE